MKRENEFLYLQLAQNIREQITTGFLKPGQFLLSENELRRQYQISRTSVRKALDLLVEEGLIVKRVGQGTIVAPNLTIRKDQRKTLTILATSPSFYIDYCMSLILEAFRHKFPQVEVKLLAVPGSAFRDSFTASLEMGFRPDLIFVSDKMWQQFALHQPGDFQDLHVRLGDSMAAMYPVLSRAFGRDGQTLAAPVSFSPVFMVYNPRLFAASGVEPPPSAWTQSEFLACAKALTRDTDGDGIADICGISLPISLRRWPSIAIACGARFQRDRDAGAMTRALNLFHDLLFRHRAATLALRSSLNSEAFPREKAGMVLTTTFELADWRYNGLGFEPQVAPLPFSGQPASQLIANVFMMPKASKEPGLAEQFLKLALSREVQENILRQAQFLSVLPAVNEAVWDSVKLQSMGLTGEAVENGYFFHELLSSSSKEALLDREMELFWAGLESASSFAERYLDMVR